MNMLRNTASKVMWVGRATVFLVGLAVILALVFGVAATAMGANGKPFILGKATNAATKVTGLVGRVAAGEALVVKNPSGGSALGLSVGDPLAHPATKTVAPMKVDSQANVENLNADKLDGKNASNFVANITYRLGQGQERPGTVLGDGSKVLSQSCLAGDRLLSGGPASVHVNSDVLDSFASDTNTWNARINDSAVSRDDFTVVVLCAAQ